MPAMRMAFGVAVSAIHLPPISEWPLPVRFIAATFP